MTTSRKAMNSILLSYKRNFYQIVRRLQHAMTIGSHVYVLKEHFGTTESHQKLSRQLTGLYVATDVDDKPCVIEL